MEVYISTSLSEKLNETDHNVVGAYISKSGYERFNSKKVKVLKVKTVSNYNIKHI
jgi:hypothetical protein